MQHEDTHIPDHIFRSIIDQLHDEIMIYDKDARLVYVNQASIRHYGISPSDMLGKKFSSLDQVFWGNSALPMVLETKKMVAKRQITNLGQDIITIAVPIFDENNKLQYVAENVNDIYYINQINKAEEASVSVRTETPKERNHFLYGSPSMKEIFQMIEKLKNISSPILILGETGTGKSFLAEHIHTNSNRANKPFVTLNCACMNPNLIESELFGYTKGAFSGASTSGKKGIVEIADGGTLFLDEISELPYELQSKLLLFLQNQEFIPLGAEKSKKVDVKIIAATNRSLKEMVYAKTFREDLYFRLNIFEIIVPPLRERTEDIAILIQHYLKKYNVSHNQNRKIGLDAIYTLERYSWPGNVRELSHVLEKLVVLSKNDTIQISDLPKELFQLKTTIQESGSLYHGNLQDILEAVEKQVVLDSYKKYTTSVAVGKALGISQPKAYRLIQKYTSHNR